MSITTDALHELFEYKEGKLYRKTDRGGYKTGTECGSLHHEGYITIKINAKKHQAHRIIYQMFYGHIARNLQIDHIDRDRANNRIENLRLVTQNENQWNRSNTRGWCKVPNGKYRARIRVQNKIKHLGYFNTPEEAEEAYLAAKTQYHIIGDS